MERERLNQLRHLAIESKHIHDKLISRTPAIRTYGDTTGDYRTGRKRIIITRGDTDPVEDRYIRRMTEKKKLIDIEIYHMEEWLDSIESSRSRNVLRLYFQEGMTQSEIGERLSIERSLVSKIIAEAVE